MKYRWFITIWKNPKTFKEYIVTSSYDAEKMAQFFRKRGQLVKIVKYSI